jgi:hypothetical protein
MNQLSDAQLEWAATFLALPKNLLAAGQSAATAAPGAAANGKLPTPMLPDCKIVHGKVHGPANHLLCTAHNHIVDIDAKTIIAHSLAEYLKSHPANRRSAAPHAASPAASRSPASAPRPVAAAPEPPATAPPKSDQPPPQGERIKIPVFTGSAKEVFAKECAVLDTFRPSKDHPDMYAAVLDGKEVSITKTQAETILAQISKQMTNSITNIAQSNHVVMTTYEHASAKGLEHIGSGVNKFVSLVKGDGWIHDPGDDLEKLQQEWLSELSAARADLGARQFQAAAQHLAEAEIKGTQAEHLLTAFENKVLKNADTTLSVLKNVESVSKTVSKTIATATFGPAGAASIDATFAAADITGEALAGQAVDWAGHFIELGMDLLMDKFGDQAKAAVEGRVKGLLEDKLKRFGKDKAKELAEQLAKKIADKVVEKGSDFVKDELHAVADKANKEKTKTYEDLAKATVASMKKPDAATTGKLEAAIEKDPEFQKEVMALQGDAVRAR